MASFFVLFKKELKQQIKTHRLLIVAAIFFVFGIGTPLMLNYLPAFLPEDQGIVLPEFTTVDVVKEHIDTFGQIGLIAAILVAMGAVAREREIGTATMTLSKPASCGAFIAAKLAALSLIFGTGIAIGTFSGYLYTIILFEDISALDFFIANLLVWLYMVFCLAITVMYSSIFKNQLAAGGLALITIIAIAVTSGFPVMEDYSPGAILTWSKSLALGNGENLWGTMIVSLGLITLAMVTGWQVFKRKEL